MPHGHRAWGQDGSHTGVDSILSIHVRMATQERAGRLGRIAKLLVSDIELKSQTISGLMGDLGVRANLWFNLA